MLRAPVIQIIGITTESEKLPHMAGDTSDDHHLPTRNGNRHVYTFHKASAEKQHVTMELQQRIKY